MNTLKQKIVCRTSREGFKKLYKDQYYRNIPH